MKRFRLFHQLILSVLIAQTCVAAIASATNQIVTADVCIYGGTSGGVIAALEAAHMGKRAVIVEPGQHVGGMTASGLSAVDIGRVETVGGLTRTYFTQLLAIYGKEIHWTTTKKSKGGPNTGGAFSIEPKVAERVFEDLLKSNAIPIYRSARLQSVKKDGARIVEIVAEDGTTFRAQMFIDTTYEGDLMAKAGVSFTLMREGNRKYGEQYNGIYYGEKFRPRPQHDQPKANGRSPDGQGVWDRDFPLDPYRVPGQPASGLIPLVQPEEKRAPGEPAPGVQAYCYRLCLTTNANLLPIEPPRDYDPAHYELVVRFIKACQANGDDIDLRWFAKYDPLPHGKWDFNTATIGANLPGASWAWPDATYAQRDEIARQHENYQRGLLYFLGHDAHVPQKVRDEMQRFGLPADEFPDHHGWPHQLYVREGRRMVSDLVMTEHHTYGQEIAPHSIGLGSYGTDTHELQRTVRNGVVIREGKVAAGRGGAGPYPIGYEAIVPRAKECENLFVTFALSASHSAFSSIRMEPVFMITSQSAATAACLAIDAKCPVQSVDYARLRAHLLKDGQILDYVADDVSRR